MFWTVTFIIMLFAFYRIFNKKQEESSIEEELPLPTVPLLVPDTSTLSPHAEIASDATEQNETFEWINYITKISWPHIGKIVQSQISTIEPLINHFLPAPFSNFTIVKAELGKDPPKLQNIIVHKRFKNAIALDFDFEFDGTPIVTMKCSPLRAPFAIKRVNWSGRVTVLLRPLIPTIPLVGAVQVAMITHPHFNMEFSGVADVANFGPIERIIHRVTKNVIASMMVLPNRFQYKLADNVDYFDIYYPPEGVMNVSIEKGSGFTSELRKKVYKSIPDLYCKASIGLEEMKTPVQMNNLFPEWRTSKSFLISELEQPFELNCYDKESLKSDVFVGGFTRTAKDLLAKRGRWIDLENTQNSVAKEGKIYLSTKFYSLSPLKHTLSNGCVVHVIIDHARNLPAGTLSSMCMVKVGSSVIRETLAVVQDPKEPGIDPSNPNWGLSFEVLCDSLSDANVKLEVYENGTIIAQSEVSAEELKNADDMTKKGYFHLKPYGILRAMIMLRGLIQDSWNTR